MPEPHHYQLTLTWSGAAAGTTESYRSYSRAWRAELPGRAPLEGSADPAFRGDPSVYNPEDLLVVSLSACHMLSYLALCAREGLKVLAYVDDAQGTMSHEPGGYRFTDVLLRPRVTVLDPATMERARALHHGAHEICFIARSVNFPVRCEPEVLVSGPGDGEV